MNCQNCLFSRKVRMKEEEEEEGSDMRRIFHMADVTKTEFRL